jgi:hypothetical protein
MGSEERGWEHFFGRRAQIPLGEATGDALNFPISAYGIVSDIKQNVWIFTILVLEIQKPVEKCIPKAC